MQVFSNIFEQPKIFYFLVREESELKQYYLKKSKTHRKRERKVGYHGLGGGVKELGRGW